MGFDGPSSLPRTFKLPVAALCFACTVHDRRVCGCGLGVVNSNALAVGRWFKQKGESAVTSAVQIGGSAVTSAVQIGGSAVTSAVQIGGSAVTKGVQMGGSAMTSTVDRVSRASSTVAEAAIGFIQSE